MTKEKEKEYNPGNGFRDLSKIDWFDIGDLGQRLLSELGAPSESERARSNFEAIKGKPRPLSHTLTDIAGRVGTDIALGALIEGIGKGTKAASKAIFKTVSKSKQAKIFKKVPLSKYIARNAPNGKDILEKGNRITPAMYRQWKNDFADDVIKHSEVVPGLTRQEVEKVLFDKLDVDRVNKDLMKHMTNPENVILKHGYDNPNILVNKAMRSDTNILGEKVSLVTKGLDDLDADRITEESLKVLYNLKSTDRQKYASRLGINISNLPEGKMSYKTMRGLTKSNIGQNLELPKQPLFKLYSEPGESYVQANNIDFMAGAGIKALAMQAVSNAINQMEEQDNAPKETPVKDFLLGMVDLDLDDPKRYRREDIENEIKWIVDKGYGNPGFFEYSPRQKVRIIKQFYKGAK